MSFRLAVFAVLIFGCSSPLTDARTSFDEARYPDAIAQYRSVQPRTDRLSRPELFEYALYRGLSHLALVNAALHVIAAEGDPVADPRMDRAPG